MARTKRYTVRAYLTEEIVVGGLPTTRQALIAELRAAGADDGAIQLYLFGLDRGCELREVHRG